MQKFWKNKKLIAELMDLLDLIQPKINGLGANVSGIIQKKNYYYIQSIHKKCKLFKGEITNKSFIQNIINKIISEISFSCPVDWCCNKSL